MSSPLAPWRRLYNDVKMHIPGVTDAVFQQMLYHVMNDFLDRTNAWTEEVSIPIVPNTVSYAFSVSHKGAPNRLMLVYDPLNNPSKNWVQGGISMVVPGVLLISQAPANAVTWKAVVAKTLGEPNDAFNYPDIEAADQWIINKYGDGIEYGVLGRLMGMPAKPFTNAKLSKDYWQAYVTERGKARTDQLRANVYGGQRWTYPQGYATTTRKGWA